MTTNLDAEQTLISIVLASPAEPPGDGDRRPYCALRRAAVVLGAPRERSLFDVAAAIGLTELEAMGVMRGWDRASAADDRVQLAFADEAEDHPEEVACGEAIGEGAWHAIAKR